MSQIIELSDAVFTKLKRRAENDGLTPEVWIEKVVKNESQLLSLPKITDEERNILGEFHQQTEKKFSRLQNDKFRREISKLNE